MTLSESDLKHLIELSEKATPGPWTYDGNIMSSKIDSSIHSVVDDVCISYEDSIFISSANPTTVKAMAEELLAARAMREAGQCTCDLEDNCEHCPAQDAYDAIRAKNEGK